MGSVHARGDTFLTFGLKALTETNTSRLATGCTSLCPEPDESYPHPPALFPWRPSEYYPPIRIKILFKTEFDSDMVFLTINESPAILLDNLCPTP
jgi:hypothetical protein